MSNTHYFKTRAEEVDYVKNNGISVPYVSYVKETGKTSYKYNEPIRLGDYLHVSGKVDAIPGNDVIGVCIVPELMLPDGKARFMSIKAMSHETTETGSTENEDMWWAYDEDSENFGDYLTKRTKVPIDGTSSGSISSNNTWGRLAMDRTDSDSGASNLTIANPQDPGTKYYQDVSTTRRIPSPYAPDGSFNTNFHYTSGTASDWALTDYRGDLNTAYVLFSEDPGADVAQAFYACGGFKPGYRDLEWYLPAIGEIAFVAPRVEYINSRITEAINSGSAGVVLPFGNLWSSSEYNSNNAWYLSLLNGFVDYRDKDNGFYVRSCLRY
jgi:hypothetical protein